MFVVKRAHTEKKHCPLFALILRFCGQYQFESGPLSTVALFALCSKP